MLQVLFPPSISIPILVVRTGFEPVFTRVGIEPNYPYQQVIQRLERLPFRHLTIIIPTTYHIFDIPVVRKPYAFYVYLL